MTNFLTSFVKTHEINLPPIINGDENQIVVAMSGGVDSSTAAALCHALGYKVIGITLQLYNTPETQKTKACCAGIDIKDAKNVAEKIGFPHYVLNYENKFKQAVIDDFADSYLKGETPIPCVRCNQTVKFTDLLQTAKNLSAKALITGHYVKRKDINGKAQLLSAKDEQKDQSYFLFATEQKQLDYIYFPLGNLNKAETRQLAKYFNLAIAEKPDSQDICFVGNQGYANLIKKLRPESEKQGDIIHIETKQVIAQHNGIANYTIGQRKGIGIGGRNQDSKPLYVIKLNPEKNQVIVGDYHHLATCNIILKEINWIGDKKFADIKNLKIQAKFRSTMQAINVTANAKNNNIQLEFNEPQHGISAGQACVLYDGTRVLGGGWIVK